MMQNLNPDFPEDKAINYRETGLNDAANKEFMAAAYKVANGIMTVDESISAYGSLWED